MRLQNKNATKQRPIYAVFGVVCLQKERNSNTRSTVRFLLLESKSLAKEEIMSEKYVLATIMPGGGCMVGPLLG